MTTLIAYENTRQVDVRPKLPQILLHTAMVAIELIELGVDVLSLARRRQHRYGDEDDEAGKTFNRLSTSEPPP
jgi:hypothetical protein